MPRSSAELGVGREKVEGVATPELPLPLRPPRVAVFLMMACGALAWGRVTPLSTPVATDDSEPSTDGSPLVRCVAPPSLTTVDAEFTAPAAAAVATADAAGGGGGGAGDAGLALLPPVAVVGVASAMAATAGVGAGGATAAASAAMAADMALAVPGVGAAAVEVTMPLGRAAPASVMVSSTDSERARSSRPCRRRSPVVMPATVLPGVLWVLVAVAVEAMLVPPAGVW